jgi:ribosomal protein S13
MDINQYGYSYADIIGRALSAPIDNIFIQIKNFREGQGLLSRIHLVCYCIIAAIIFVPCGTSWLVGRVFSHYAISKVDPDALILIPIKIDINPNLGNMNNVDISYLKKCLKFTDKKKCLADGVNKIIKKKNINENFYVHRLVHEQFEFFIKAIVKKMTMGEVSNDQKGIIVKELAEATEFCVATWVEVAGKIYFELYGNAESPETKILRLVQYYKEALILHILQVDLNRHWHTLNKARQILGKELGLDQTLEKFDNYAQDPNYSASQLSRYEISFIRNEFYRQYSDVNRLVEAIQTKINMGNSNDIYQGYSKLLEKIVRNHGVKNEPSYKGDRVANFVTENCFSDSSKIKPEAVNLMLRHIGLIK